MAKIVLDNGAYTAKVGYSQDTEPKLIPNCITKAKNIRTRIFIGEQIDECKDLSGLYYLLPFQKGYLVNWDIERQVWDHIFGKECLKVDFEETGITITEPYFNFSSIQEATNEIFFEEYQFKSLFRCNGGYLAQFKYSTSVSGKTPVCCMVVDSGYSFTHLVPYCQGNKVMDGVKRINVGGKILTNHLKEIISYRQLMVMDETYVMNQMKEDVCYVSTDFMDDMKIARIRGKENTIVRDYVLPDYTHIKRGHIRPIEEIPSKANAGEQIIRMCNERFAVPEILFHPSDVGIQEMGVAESIIYSIQCTPEEMHPHLFANIVVTGGNCKLQGFKERLYKDVRAMAPDEFDVNIYCSNSPISYTWEGGCALSKDPEHEMLSVTREQYDEYGHNICMEKFDV